MGYPLYIFYAKRTIFKIDRTDFETKQFLLGYVSSLQGLVLIWRGITASKVNKSAKSYLFKLMSFKGRNNNLTKNS